LLSGDFSLFVCVLVCVFCGGTHETKHKHVVLADTVLCPVRSRCVHSHIIINQLVSSVAIRLHNKFPQKCL
jgi:hypothetical protein